MIYLHSALLISLTHSQVLTHLILQKGKLRLKMFGVLALKSSREMSRDQDLNPALWGPCLVFCVVGLRK